ncbi:hypothetical protein [Candidatus Spongiihabitans sp.]|uniref:hypothetical protein n=1 Tax=Candidatus Spongiihabitans sp. TaxID=3101308 RepID=UPI003C6F8016
MTDTLHRLLALINENNGINDKARLASIVRDNLGLVKDRSVYYCADYALRFSSATGRNFGNTVLSLSNLRKYDNRPFIVCLVTPSQNHCLITNTTFLKKVSHSSHELRQNNIRGSCNGSDIVRDFEGISNVAENIGRLFAIHAEIGFEGNLVRLVEATNDISPSGNKYHMNNEASVTILEAPGRAMRFVRDEDCAVLKEGLDTQVEKFKMEILLAALIENVNVRGRIIEYLIAGEDESLRQQILSALKDGDSIPPFMTDNTLGDYHRSFDTFDTETDIKTNIMILNSNPKAYNLDKMLEFLAGDRSVFMFYFVGVDAGKNVNTVLISMFQKDLLSSTILLRHWAGRNSRGVTQFEGKTINDLMVTPDATIDELKSVEFLKRVMEI